MPQALIELVDICLILLTSTFIFIVGLWRVVGFGEKKNFHERLRFCLYYETYFVFFFFVEKCSVPLVVDCFGKASVSVDDPLFVFFPSPEFAARHLLKKKIVDQVLRCFRWCLACKWCQQKKCCSWVDNGLLA